MSTHLLIAAAYVDLNRAKPLDPSVKLVLMAYADSADEHSQESAPGLPKLRAWGGRGKSRTLEIVTELIAEGLLTQVSSARLGKRAVYRVFPRGVPAIPHPSEVAEKFPTGKPRPVDNSPIAGSGPPDPRVHETSSWVRPTGPLHAIPSVNSATRPRKPARPVDKSTAGGFPAKARTASLPVSPRCEHHPERYLPCEVCFEGRLPPEEARTAAARLREMMTLRPATDQEPTP